MDINSLSGERLFLVQFEEEFCWEVEENGFVIIVGADHFEAFKEKVASRQEEEDFYFPVRCKLNEMESQSSRTLHQEYAQEYLKKVIGKTREISFVEFKALNNALGRINVGEQEPTLFYAKTNEYSPGSKIKLPYFSWGYDIFYSTIMDDYS